MAWQNICPACGEAEQLRGRTGSDEIEIHCLVCGHQWKRGERRCATCGGSDIVDVPRTMTRQPRGNQVAVVGRRDLPICRTCDADVLQAYLTSNRPVTQDYVSAALVDREAPRSTAAEPRSGRPVKRPRAGPVPSTPGPSRASAKAAISASPIDPTVRQAVEDFLSEDNDADPTVLVLLGAKLGPTRRLAELEKSDVSGQLASWIDATWGEGGGRRTAAVETISRLTRHWFKRGWTTVDVGATLK